MTETVRGLDQQALLADLRKQVKDLEDDLRARSDEVEEFAEPLHAEYAAAFDAKRTAATYQAWRDERVTQVAVAWVLATVFARFCEDNRLIDEPFLAGPDDRLTEAEERHGAYIDAHPHCNDRDWIIEAFNHLAGTNETVAGLFDRRHNPLWEITPSYEAATALLRFWRRRGPDGEIVHDFTDSSWNTRFLGDLYQNLSESARKTYALLQTPEFVEEFILDLTLTPAINEFGLPGLRTIDPACGSGHFLLGIFHRLLTEWRKQAPDVNLWDLIRRSLESVHGCDKNPFAVSIARFRLLVAVMAAGGETRLATAPSFPINVAVGDSLLHGRGAPGIQDRLFTLEEPYTYRTEDVNEFVKSCDLLGRSSYHLVVGNPPYITVKDKQENENYRKMYRSCSGKYALSVPFAERLFQLAVRTHGSERNAGLVGQITANSFMKREFGKKLIEQFFPTVHLTHIIDTSGLAPALEGHPTPTVILVGRNHMGRPDQPIRALLGVRGEPSRPDDPAKACVWLAILEQIGKPGSESEWITAEDADRDRFASHPWSVSGGGSLDLVSNLENQARTIADLNIDIGMTVLTLEDEVYILDTETIDRKRLHEMSEEIVIGDRVRNYQIDNLAQVLMPVDLNGNKRDLSIRAARHFWRWRTNLRNRLYFSKTPQERGLRWFDLGIFFASRNRTPLSITFAEMATHNHFVLDRGGKVFKQTAPVIKLSEGVSEGEHLALLGALNSSTSCFWLKQKCFPKGGSGMGRGIQPEGWMERYAFNASNVEQFPLPERLPIELGRVLDSLARRLSEQEPSAVCDASIPTRARLDTGRVNHGRIWQTMIALQEELDWTVYGSYGLLTEAEAAQLIAKEHNEVPEVRLGERAFEIVLARKRQAGEIETAWFERHGSRPVAEIPRHWPEWYREIVWRRIELIEKRRDIALIERPECKRRWAIEPWEKKEERALRSWLLDRCERKALWFALRDGMRHPRTLTVNQLADSLRSDHDVHDVAQLYAADHLGNPDLTLTQVLEKVIADEHVPYLAALRYQESGMRTREQWERVWEMQREEDRTGKRLDIPVPPKYKPADFRKSSYWSQRDKLDVPKERLVSYPGASPESDPTLLLGWAGWDHKDQAQALVNVVNDRTEQASWGKEELTPLLAGLAELMPWVRQWHSGYDDEWGGDPAEEFQAFLDSQRAKLQLTEDDLRTWRPRPTTRGRRKVAHQQ